MKIKSRAFLIVTTFVFHLNLYSLEQSSPVIQSTTDQQYTLQKLKHNTDLSRQIINHILSSAGYSVVDDDFSLIFKASTIIGNIKTNKGIKFIKLHDQGNGTQEFNGAMLLSHHFPVNKYEALVSFNSLELIVQPFIFSIQSPGGMLFDTIVPSAFSCSCSDHFQNIKPLFKKMYFEMQKVASKTLNYKSAVCPIDRLYFERLKSLRQDRKKGRLEAWYENTKVLNIDWETLLDAKFVVDGIEYQESLRELIDRAKEVLNPTCPRMIHFSHGDWHDMNVAVFPPMHDCTFIPESYSYLDTELVGDNGLIEDSMVYLVYNTIQGAYLAPKYSPANFPNRKLTLDPYFSKPISIKIEDSMKKIHLDKVELFGTSLIRKQIASLFLQDYLIPLIEEARNQFSQLEKKDISERIKACILLRILCVYNVSNLAINDQAKVLGLIFKALGSPINSEERNPDYIHALNNFVSAL